MFTLHKLKNKKKSNQNQVFLRARTYRLDTPLCVKLLHQKSFVVWMMHSSEQSGLRCEWVIGYTLFNQILGKRMRTYVIENATKERHIRKKEGKCFPVIFELPEELRQDLTCHNTSWNACVCVRAHSFLPFYESLFALWGGKSKRGGKTVSVLVETDCCVCVFKDNTITPTCTPLSELKSPQHMHTPLLSLSQPILCSGHTFAIVLLTTKQTAANISPLCGVLGWAAWIVIGYSTLWGGAFPMLLFCTFLALTPACFHFNPALMIATVFWGFFFALGLLCFCGLLKIVSDMHSSFSVCTFVDAEMCFIFAVALLQM